MARFFPDCRACAARGVVVWRRNSGLGLATGDRGCSGRAEIVCALLAAAPPEIGIGAERIGMIVNRVGHPPQQARGLSGLGHLFQACADVLMREELAAIELI